MKKYVVNRLGDKSTLSELEKPPRIKKGLSIVIATYNEEGNVEKLVRKIRKNIKKDEFKESYEIVIVDDDSKDGTPKLIDKLVEEGDVVAVHRKDVRGLFSAIMDGIKISEREFILTMDADFSHPPEMIPELLKYKKYDIVSGSRFVKGGGTEAPPLRNYGSKALNKICSTILGVPVKDLGGDFHLFRRTSLEKIEYKYPARFGEFSFETFYRAHKLGMKVKEVPFVYKFRKEGKSKMKGLGKTALVYLKRAFQLKFSA